MRIFTCYSHGPRDGGRPRALSPQPQHFRPIHLRRPALILRRLRSLRMGDALPLVRFLRFKVALVRRSKHFNRPGLRPSADAAAFIGHVSGANSKPLTMVRTVTPRSLMSIRMVFAASAWP